MTYASIYLAGCITTPWLYVAHQMYFYASYRASGPRGIILNPNGRNLGLFVWCIAWPVLCIIDSRKRDWNWRHAIGEWNDE